MVPPRPRFEWVGQEQEADCGLAALAMMARYHGLDVSVEQLRRCSSPGEHGLNLGQLERLARAWGLLCKAVRVGPGQWGRLRLPAIVHLKEGHFVVLFRLDEVWAEVGDPAVGLLRQARAGFEEGCSGKALVFAAPGRAATVEG